MMWARGGRLWSMVSSPTVRRRRLGSELRRLREAAGLSNEDAAGHLGCSSSKISRMENGRVPFNWRDVRDLLTLYQVPEEEAEPLLAIARESRQRGWWHDYSAVLPPWFEVYVGLEAEATSIRTYQAQLVPGLLQTEAYARALLVAGRSDEVERQVGLRMKRQEVLTKPGAPQLWAVLDEAVLRRPVGGAEVMRQQLRYLADLALANVTVQVLPYSAGAHPAMLGAFVILEFGESEVIYLEDLSSALYLEKPEEIRRYSVTFDVLRAEALGQEQSANLMRQIAGEYK